SLRTQDFPPPEPPRPVTKEIAKPAELTWIKQLKGNARLETLPDGAIELRADNVPEKGFVAAPLPKLALAEVIFEVADATPGSGVYLGRQDGQPIEVLRSSKNTRDGGLCLSLRPPNDDARETHY